MGSSMGAKKDPKKDAKTPSKTPKKKEGGGGKAKKKKWSKGKTRDKLNNLVLFDKGTYDKLYKEVPTYKLSFLLHSLPLSFLLLLQLLWGEFLLPRLLIFLVLLVLLVLLVFPLLLLLLPRQLLGLLVLLLS